MERVEDIPRLEDCPIRDGWLVVDEGGAAYTRATAEILICERLEAAAAATVDLDAYEECRLLLWSWGYDMDASSRLPLLFPDLLEHRVFADEVHRCGVGVEAILAVADVLGEYAAAAADGVPIEDLFA